MSNEIDVIKNLKNSLAAIQGEVDADTRAVAGTDLGKRISVKGGVFRKISNGKEVGTIEDRHMDVIFVKTAHTASRMYYSGTYVEGENASPACWSSDTLHPDSAVETPQATQCSMCPQSVSGSAPQGQGTACRYQWRTAVVLPQDPGGDVLQLVIPSMSIWAKEPADTGKRSFVPYAQMLADAKISLSRVVTQMQFDTKAAVPKLLFSPIGPVKSEDLPLLKSQAESAAAEAAVAIPVFKRKKSAEGVAPSAPQLKEISEQVTLPLPEPTLHKTTSSTHAEIPDILKKWSGKA